MYAVKYFEEWIWIRPTKLILPNNSLVASDGFYNTHLTIKISQKRVVWDDFVFIMICVAISVASWNKFSKYLLLVSRDIGNHINRNPRVARKTKIISVVYIDGCKINIIVNFIVLCFRKVYLWKRTVGIAGNTSGYIVILTLHNDMTTRFICNRERDEYHGAYLLTELVPRNLSWSK